MNKQRVNESIDKAIAALIQMKRFLVDSVPTVVTPVELEEIVLAEPEYNFDFANWPLAVPEHLICSSDDEVAKTERARGILEHMIDEDLQDLNFLDFGCGDGHVAFYAAEKNATVSVGYDVKFSDVWNGLDARNLELTTDWNKVLEKAPYDVILCFDVLDHLEGTEPTSMLRQLYDVLSKNGKIYLRTHPWTSRHATHLYHRFNKAYAHLVMTEDELARYVPNYELEPNLRVQYPLKTYANYFQQANLKVLNMKEVRGEVESYFKQEDIAKRIMHKSRIGEFPEYQMSLEFIDYVLSRP